MKKHRDDINIGHSICFSFGDHSKGELIIYEPLENGGERKIIRNVFKKVLKYDGNVPHSVEAAGPGADSAQVEAGCYRFRLMMSHVRSARKNQWLLK